jgi:serine/threonine protein phosphatase 1
MAKDDKIGIIGDIHGCINALRDLFNKLIVYTGEIYSVGDFIDRGPDSKSVIQFYKDNNIRPVIGNHEDMLLNAIRKSNYGIVPGYEPNLIHWLWNGGDKTTISYIGKKSKSFRKFTDEFRDCGHYDFISKLPLEIELENCIISHGGILLDKPLEDALWNRELPSKLGKIQIIGHTPTPKIELVKDHYINIDTG